MIAKIVVTLIAALLIDGLIVYAAWAAYKVGCMRGWRNAMRFVQARAAENREAYPEFYESPQGNEEKNE